MYPSPEDHQIKSFYCAKCGFQVRSPVACGFRFCPFCSRRRAARIKARIMWLISRRPPDKRHRLVHITLSVKNTRQIAPGIKHLVQSFRRLRQRKSWKARVEGGCYVIEITGAKADYHPHLHILARSKYYPWKSLQKQWRQCSGGQAAYIREVSGPKAVSYLTKYVTKTDMPDDCHEELNSQLAKYRLFTVFGYWHALRIPKRIHDFPCPSCGSHDWIPDILIDRHVRFP